MHHVGFAVLKFWTVSAQFVLKAHSVTDNPINWTDERRLDLIIHLSTCLVRSMTNCRDLTGNWRSILGWWLDYTVSKSDNLTTAAKPHTWRIHKLVIVPELFLLHFRMLLLVLEADYGGSFFFWNVYIYIYKSNEIQH
jgi:hypothetical protein